MNFLPHESKALEDIVNKTVVIANESSIIQLYIHGLGKSYDQNFIDVVVKKQNLHDIFAFVTG